MIYVFLADGFEETEALVCVDVLRRCGIDTQTVGISGKQITGSHGISVIADTTDENLLPDEHLTGIILPGGLPGTTNLDATDTVHSFLEFCHENDLIIAAICAAPSILGKKGYLKNKRATCNRGFEKHLDGAVFTGSSVETDGKIVTGRSMGCSIDFAFAVANKFADEETVQKVRETILCP